MNICNLSDGVFLPETRQEVLDITRQLLAELGQHNDCEIEEKKSKLEQLKTVLEMCVVAKLAHAISRCSLCSVLLCYSAPVR